MTVLQIIQFKISIFFYQKQLLRISFYFTLFWSNLTYAPALKLLNYHKISALKVA